MPTCHNLESLGEGISIEELSKIGCPVGMFVGDCLHCQLEWENEECRGCWQNNFKEFGFILLSYLQGYLNMSPIKS